MSITKVKNRNCFWVTFVFQAFQIYPMFTFTNIDLIRRKRDWCNFSLLFFFRIWRLIWKRHSGHKWINSATFRCFEIYETLWSGVMMMRCNGNIWARPIFEFTTSSEKFEVPISVLFDMLGRKKAFHDYKTGKRQTRAPFFPFDTSKIFVKKTKKLKLYSFLLIIRALFEKLLPGRVAFWPQYKFNYLSGCSRLLFYFAVPRFQEQTVWIDKPTGAIRT